MKLDSDSRSRRNHLLALGLFATLTLLMTWPVAARLGTHLAGGRDDLWVHQWTFWWVREALGQGISPFFTPYLYAPLGASLTSHNIAWFNIALWLPLQALLGHVTAYNLVFLAVVTLNGFCQYLFSFEEIRSYGPALVAGIIVGYWPYTLSHYDHANMMVVFWVPLTLLLLRRLLLPDSTSGRVPWFLLMSTAITLAMIGITRWQLLVMSGPILAGYTLYLVWRYPTTRRRETILMLLAVVLIAGLLMAPLAAPLVRDQLTRQFPSDVLLDEAVWGRTDLLAYFLPSIHSGLWREFVTPYYANFVVNQFYTPYIGYTTLLLGVVGVLRRWRQTWIWFSLAVFFTILALGPELAINGRAFPTIPMPYGLVEDFFLVRLIRRPDRLNIFLSLPVAMLAGWGMQTILARIKTGDSRRAWSYLATGIVMVLLLLAYEPVPFATAQMTVPDWYRQTAGTSDPFAVLDLPVNDRSYDKWYMMYQIEHGRPMATGHVSRLPGEATVFLDSIPLVANLSQRDQLPDRRLQDVGQQLRQLADGGIRYLVLHKQFANEGLLAEWREWLVIEPAHEDNELIAYNTEPLYGRDFIFQHALTENLGLVRAQVEPQLGNQSGVLKVHAIWGTDQPPGAPYDVCLALRDSQGNEHDRFCQLVSTRWPVEFWAGGDLYRLTHAMPLGDDLPPGNYELVMELTAENSGERLGQEAALGQVTIEPFAPALVTEAVWDESIRLHGATLAAEDGTLLVTLYWEAIQPPSQSLKAFVHVVDLESGAVVAQSDAIPRNWTYPTTGWEPREIVRDHRVIVVEQLPPGTYSLRLGLYDEHSGERLQLSGSDGEPGGDSFILGPWSH